MSRFIINIILSLKKKKKHETNDYRNISFPTFLDNQIDIYLHLVSHFLYEIFINYLSLH